ncbi:hypothetical protein CC80DRAFT_530508 [Byssothecium circinans]|uniref:Uncharacterized protein n=1 Tax=Byssothecium circinans TaxID=147558 RepID=A0A6A5UHA4_9PLEO|nr:hypothetical protein CC80DRAFT_530508 [Byssothecium circinans]
MFPFVTNRREVAVSRIDIFIDSDKPCKIGEHFHGCFMPRGGCKDDLKTFELTSSCHTPGFFHGVLQGVQFGSLHSDRSERFGHSEFPEALSAANVRQTAAEGRIIAPAYLYCSILLNPQMISFALLVVEIPGSNRG